MKAALWIIAICEVIRAVQNLLQLWMLKRDTRARDNAYAEFIKSLKQTDKEFVRRMLEEFERRESAGELGKFQNETDEGIKLGGYVDLNDPTKLSEWSEE